MTSRELSFLSCAVAASVALGGCSGGGSAASNLPPPSSVHHRSGSGSTPIEHVVLMIQENRTYNNLFATFPGALGTTTGEELVKQKNGKYKKKSIPLAKVDLESHNILDHRYAAYVTAYHNGAMDGFNIIKRTTNNKFEGKAPYQYVNPSQIQPYLTIASQWGLADEMFQTQGGGSFIAHQDLIRGGSCITSVCNPPSANTESLVDDPTTSAAWGCDSPPGTKTSLINSYGQVSNGTGPFPCSNQFPDYGSNGYETLRDLLDAKSVPWKYYTPQFKSGTWSALWDAFDVIYPVRYGSEWSTNIVSPETTIFGDLTSGTLPAMSWVIPDSVNSDHPGSSSDTGPSWVASVVNAIGQSQYWNSTAVIVVWDDWGGFYDPVAPSPLDQQGGPGFRVGMLVISPYVKIGAGSQGGYVSNTVYGFGSILRFIEDTFNLGRLGTTDSSSTSMADMFDLNQSPRPFSTIPSTYKKAFFLHQNPSGLPVDTQ
jgi:phospholipase C